MESNNEPKTRKKFTVNGMSCESCAESVAQALNDVSGVKEVEVSLPREEVLVTYDGSRLEPEKLGQALSETGYELVT